ncbi:MAG TPA: hypothetical protein VHU40_02800 [Polyangia bacterium]|nr:hypothetical protein [Polyangia bacterium]
MTSPAGEQLDDTGEALWRAAEAAWDVSAHHDAFVGHAFASHQLVAAAARYRARLAAHPNDATARQMIARVGFLATQALRPSPRPTGPLSRSPFFIAVIAVAALVGALLGLFYGAGR